MSSSDSPQKTPKQQQYRQLPHEEEHHDDYPPDSDDEESSSLVDSDRIFRSWKDDTTIPVEVNSSTASLSASSSLHGDHDHGSTSPPLHHHHHHQILSSRSRNSSSHSLHHDDDDDDDWEEEDIVRRYHTPHELPLPAEFSHDSLPKRVWHSFLELRMAARQRRAARLLTMPSESFANQCHACLLTWCCDATDRGILLVAAIMTCWLLVGWVAGMPSSYWYTGILLFGIRVSSRSLYESLHRKRRRLRSEAVELAATSWKANAKESNSNLNVDVV